MPGCHRCMWGLPEGNSSQRCFFPQFNQTLSLTVPGAGKISSLVSIRQFDGEALMKRRVFFLAFGIAVFFIAANAPTAQALPKQGTGGKCDCLCEAPSGVNPFGVIQTFNTYDSHGLGCGALVGATCNVNNPNTGGIATGSVKTCAPVSNASRRSVIILPNGIKLSPLQH